MSHAGIEFEEAVRLRYAAPDGYDPEALAQEVLHGTDEALERQYMEITHNLESCGFSYPFPESD